MDTGNSTRAIGPDLPADALNRGTVIRRPEVTPSDVNRTSVQTEISKIDEQIAPLESYVEREANRGLFGRDAFARNDAKMRLVRHYFERARKLLSLTVDPDSEIFQAEVDRLVGTADGIMKDYYQYPESQYIKAEALIFAGRYEEAADTCRELLEDLDSTWFRNRLNIPFWRLNGYKSRAFTLLGRALSMHSSTTPGNEYPQEGAYRSAIECLSGRFSFDAQLNAESRLGLGEVELSKCRESFSEESYLKAERSFLDALNSGRSMRMSDVEALLSSLDTAHTISPSKPSSPVMSRTMVAEFFGTDDSWKQFFYDGSLSQSISERRTGDAAWNVTIGWFSSYDPLKEDVIEFRRNAKELIQASSLNAEQKEFLLTALDSNNPVFVKSDKITGLFGGLGAAKDSWRLFFDNPESSILKFRHDAKESIERSSLPREVKTELLKIIAGRGDNFELNPVQYLSMKNGVEEDILIRSIINIADGLVMRGEAAKDHEAGKAIRRQAEKLLEFILRHPFVEHKTMLYTRALDQMAKLEISSAMCCSQNDRDNNGQLVAHIRNAFALNAYLNEYVETSLPEGSAARKQWIADIYENHAKILSLYYLIDSDEREELEQYGIGPFFTYGSFSRIMGRRDYQMMCAHLTDTGRGENNIPLAVDNRSAMDNVLNEAVFLLPKNFPITDEMLEPLGLDNERRAEAVAILNSRISGFPIDQDSIENTISGLMGPIKEARENPDQLKYNRAMIADLSTTMIRETILEAADIPLDRFMYALRTLNEIEKDKEMLAVFDDAAKFNNPWLRTNNNLALTACGLRLALLDKDVKLSVETRQEINSMLGIDLNAEESAALSDEERKKIITNTLDKHINPGLAEIAKYYGLEVTPESLPAIGELWDDILAKITSYDKDDDFKKKATQNTNDICALTSNSAAKAYLHLSQITEKDDDIQKAKNFAFQAVTKPGVKPKISELALITYADCSAQEIIAVLAQGKADEAFKMANDRFSVDKKDGIVTIKTLTVKDSEGKDIPATLPADSVDAIPAKLILANALIAKSFDPENEDEKKLGGEVRDKVTKLVGNAEALLDAKYDDFAKAPLEVQAQIADIAALRIYVEMGKGTGFKIANVDSLVGHDGKKVHIKLADNKTLSINDPLMQQKLQLALINAWMKTGKMTKEQKATTNTWINQIGEKTKSAAFYEAIFVIESFLRTN